MERPNVEDMKKKCLSLWSIFAEAYYTLLREVPLSPSLVINWALEWYLFSCEEWESVCDKLKYYQRPASSSRMLHTLFITFCI
jgi:hypothetical protein